MNWLALAISISATLNIALACSRVPYGTTAAKSPVDESYAISMVNNPQTYIPGQKYNVSLIASNDLSFISFMLGVESESGGSDAIDAAGSFEITDLAETRFSPRCANLVENTNTNVKTRIDVVWVAPSAAAKGCIILKATVVQHRDVWFMDDGFLTKRLCEEEVDDIDSQPTILDTCDACDEAKYELTFEGKWSRHTHPKDFPVNNWRTRFSDIIGASHTVDYHFWKYGELASEGVREIAEHGATRTLETELKDKSDQIRTIIKARGIAYPDLTGKTHAVFRVDSQHHVISFLTKIDPSPDWIVGVSGLELCLPNGSWVESKVHNLYPWDAGTDMGPSYMAADQPQVPPDVIRRIKSNFPNDRRSPFFDKDGAPMKPLATLYLNRRRLYEKTCDNADSENEPLECATHHWSPWDECSAKCGRGKQYRTREFKNPTLAQRSKCRTSLRQEQDCTGRQCEGENTDAEETTFDVVPVNAECAISEWDDWSSCSVSCGQGVQVRQRHYLAKGAKKKCQRKQRLILREEQQCQASECGGDIEGENGGAGNGDPDDQDNEVSGTKSLFGNINDDIRYRDLESFSQQSDNYIPPECGVSHWSDFSPCLGPCGGAGTSERQRVVWNKDEVYRVQKPDRDPTLDPCRHIKRREVVTCTTLSCDAIVPALCYEDLKASHCRDSDVANYWFYDHMSDQCSIFWADKCDKNRNKFASKEVCDETCRLPRKKMEMQRDDLKVDPIDCTVSKWVNHPCNVTCGEGIQIKTRKVLRSPKYGGKPCPKHLVRLEKCYQRCDDIYSVGGYVPQNYEDKRVYHHQVKQETQIEEKNECRYSDWSVWTPCTSSCGDNSYRQRTRTLLNIDMHYKCKDRVIVEKCKMMPCQLTSNDDSDRK